MWGGLADQHSTGASSVSYRHNFLVLPQTDEITSKKKRNYLQFGVFVLIFSF